MSRPYDLVVYGATGRVGRQVLRRLDAHRDASGLRIAIAGRDRHELRDLAAQLSANVGVLPASTDDPAALRAMASQGRILLNLAGPYALCGEPVVSACINAGTDYLDVTGETAHVRRLIDRYHTRAEAAGVVVVPFCGFDSVPSDIGVLLLAEHFRRRGQVLVEAKGYFRILGRLNAGTMATALALWDRPDDVRAMEDPFLLSPGCIPMAERLRHADPRMPAFDADLGRWVGPFWMGPINTRVVRRSAALASGNVSGYGRRFRYREYWDPGGPMQAVAAGTMAWGINSWNLLAHIAQAAQWSVPFIREELDQSSESVGDGGFYRALFLGIGSNGSRCWAELSDRGDPSNQATVKIVCECALLLASTDASGERTTRRGGVLTPASALGLRLLGNLRRQGVRVACPR